MKIKIILVILTLQFACLQGQPCGFYDKQTNTFQLGFRNNGFLNNNPVPSLFNWQVIYTSGESITDLFFIDSMYGWATDANGGFLKTTDSGFNWKRAQIVSGTGPINGVHFLDRDTGWICGSMGRIRKTTNNGRDWINQDTMEGYNWSVHFMNYNTGYISGLRNGYGYIIETTNSGETWQQIYLGGDYNDDVLEQFWLNADTGWFCGRDVLLKTIDAGNNFFDYYPNIPPISNGFNALLGIYFLKEQTGWISGSNDDHKNIYKTTNSGTNWFFQDNPISPYQFSQLNDVIFINEDTGWAAAYVGKIIVTSNGGINWVIDLDAPNSFWCFSSHVATKLWCGAGYGEIWYLDNLPPIGIEPIGSKIPEKFNLKQNFPNPFNNQTTIEFDLPDKVEIKLKIFDLIGREIETVCEGIYDAGFYSINYNSQNIASGIYIYSLEAENHRESKKFVLIK